MICSTVCFFEYLHVPISFHGPRKAVVVINECDLPVIFILRLPLSAIDSLVHRKATKSLKSGKIQLVVFPRRSC